jgi:hypothetical protein
MVPGSSPLLLARQKNSVSGSSLRVELVRFRVHYDLPKPSDWRQNHQDHPENDADLINADTRRNVMQRNSMAERMKKIGCCRGSSWAYPVGEPREAEPLGLVDREPHDAGKLAETKRRTC